MFLHSIEPQILDTLPSSHPLHGQDLREFSDERLADAASRGLLPGFDRLISHLDYSVEAHQVSADLAASVLRRVTRILIQRTRVLRLTDDGDLNLRNQDELLEAVTLSFVHMVGAFDALAIINGCLAGMSRYPSMGWQKPAFRKAIQEHSSAAQLFEPGTIGNRYLGAVLSFRNTIHRRMPDTGTSGPAGADLAHRHAVLTLESQSHQEIITSFEAADWTRYMGVERAGGSCLVLRPDTLIGLLINDGIPLLNAVMDATPVESLGPRRYVLDPNDGLYPQPMRDYALRYLGITRSLNEWSSPRWAWS